jgi:glycosyltransferase involved in cell wall biosynthesis
MSACIGFVYFGAYPDIRVVKMTDTLAKAGFEVFVLARNIKGVTEPGTSHPYAASRSVEQAEWRHRLHLRRVLDSAPERWRAPLTLPYHVNPIWGRAIRDLVVKDGCRLLIVRDMPLMLAATAVGRRYGVPVIFDMAENYPAAMAEWRKWEGRARAFVNLFARNITVARMVERAAIRAADRILVVVPEHIERVARLRGTAEGIEVVENTPVLEELDALYAQCSEMFDRQFSNRILHIVYGGEVHFYRGMDTLLHAASIIKMRGEKCIFWTVVGGGKALHQVQQLCKNLSVSEEEVRFVGWRPLADLMGYVFRGHVGYAGFHASEFTHMTMPNKVYDYMAFRKPVLVSDCRPMKRLVETHRCGLVFRSQDAEDLVEKVLQLRDPALRAELGASGRKAVEERYHWGVDGKRLEEVVRQVIQDFGTTTKA